MTDRADSIRISTIDARSTLTVQPRVVDALERMADDLVIGRARLSELAVLIDPAERTLAALDVVIAAPSLAPNVLSVIGSASPHLLSSETRHALVEFVEKPTSPRRAQPETASGAGGS